MFLTGCMLCLFTILSCSNFFNHIDQIDEEASISVYLPEASARAANAADYTYTISFIHDSGTTVLEGKGGAAVTLESAEVGEYTIKGQAFDAEQKLAYEGSATVTVAQGDKAEVTLILKKVADPAVTKHMTLESDAAGIKITLRYAEGEKPWNVDYCTEIWDEATGTGLVVLKAPAADAPVVYYFPFTEKGKTYDITLGILHSDNTWEQETAVCEAGGGDLGLFTYNENYNTAELVLDSENFSGYLTKDTSTIFNNEAVKKLCDKVEFDLPIFKVPENDEKEFLFAQNFIYYSAKDGFYADASNQIIKPSSFHRNGYKFVSELISTGKWTSDNKYWIELKAYPGVRYRTSRIEMTPVPFKTPKPVADTKHMHVENCTEGLKVVLKYDAADNPWQDYTAVTDCDTQIKMTGYDNELPSAENKEISYIFPVCRKNEMSAIQLSLGQSDGNKEEFVYIIPNAGMKDTIVMDDEFYNSSINVNQATMTASISNDLIPLVFSEAAIKAGKFTRIGYVISVISGNIDWSNTEWICGTEMPYVKSGNEQSENRTAMKTGFNLTDIDRYIKYKIGKRDIWGVIISFRFTFTGINTVFETQGVASEYKYTGQHYEFVTGAEVIDEANGWDIYYECINSDLPNITVLNSTLSSIKFTIDKGFNNDDFEYQIRLHTTVDGLTGSKLAPNMSMICSQDAKIEINSNDGINNLSYRQFELTADTTEVWVSELEDRYNASVSDDITILVIPYTAGTYTIEIEELNYGL